MGPGEKFMQEAAPAWMQGLNERQIKAMEVVARQGRVTNKEYHELFAVSDTTALNDLTDLVARGFLVTIGFRRGRFYKLAENAR